MKPLIGVTLDSEAPGGYSRFPWYALRENYCAAIMEAGGTPIALPHEADLVDDYLNRLDGLLVTGGAFDIDPARFGAASRHASVTIKEKRTAFEWAMVEGALSRDMPVFGICGGQQLLNVVLGGSLIQHIPDEFPNALAHEQPNPRNEPSHTVALAAGSKLRAICGQDRLSVNSAHHQAVKGTAPGIVINAVAGDGIIEGIEDPRRRFCIGVQWHPEFLLSDGDRNLFRSFIVHCRS
ncbi:MAG TPA: gamma-glutamyl-gamma-aminobutyrate hydrolase family protein [Dongiaceae bacterium]|jgi:putative glutamine amidotransferase|nr:gamma-glutamyl-gamma-aminobutyrate hydrolase family protein [Dongiaceae bacterium]